MLRKQSLYMEGVGAGGAVMLASRETGKRVTAFRSCILCTMTKGFEGTLKAREIHGGFSGRTLSALAF